jgi:predicted double-glycine peptidase
MFFAMFFGVVATLIGGAALTGRVEVAAAPKDQFELPLAVVGAGPVPQAVTIASPYSEFKFRNVVRQGFDYSCGSAALVTILNYYLDENLTEKTVMEGMLEKGEKEKIVARRAFSLLDMKRYAASLGHEAAGFRGEVKDLMALEHPAIVPIEHAGFKHFVVLRGIHNGLVYIADPATGNIVFSVEKFAAIWDAGTLFLVYPKNGQVPDLRLALTNRELGVVDFDRIVQLQPLDHSAQLQRAVDSSFGNVFFHKQ